MGALLGGAACSESHILKAFRVNFADLGAYDLQAGALKKTKA